MYSGRNTSMGEITSLFQTSRYIFYKLACVISGINQILCKSGIRQLSIFILCNIFNRELALKINYGLGIQFAFSVYRFEVLLSDNTTSLKYFWEYCFSVPAFQLYQLSISILTLIKPKVSKCIYLFLLHAKTIEPFAEILNGDSYVTLD